MFIHYAHSYKSLVVEIENDVVLNTLNHRMCP